MDQRSINTMGGDGERRGRELSREIKDRLADWRTFANLLGTGITITITIATTNARFLAFDALFFVRETVQFEVSRNTWKYDQAFESLLFSFLV